MTKKRYDEQPEQEPMIMNEPSSPYGVNPFNEALEEDEELADSLSSEEFKRNMFRYIDKLFGE